MPRPQVVAKDNGFYGCPMKKCDKKYTLLSSLRNHCRIAHKISISSINISFSVLDDENEFPTNPEFFKRDMRSMIYEPLDQRLREFGY